jgi:hypothetical protein
LGFVVDIAALGQVFFRVLRFSLPLIPPIAPHTSSIIRGWYSGPNSGRRAKWFQYHLTPRTKEEKVGVFVSRAFPKYIDFITLVDDLAVPLVIAGGHA